VSPRSRVIHVGTEEAVTKLDCLCRPQRGESVFHALNLYGSEAEKGI